MNVIRLLLFKLISDYSNINSLKLMSVLSSQTSFPQLSSLFSFLSANSRILVHTFRPILPDTISRVIKDWGSYVCFALLNKLDNIFGIGILEFSFDIVFLEVELYVSLLKIVIVHLDRSSDLSRSQVKLPSGQPFSSPVVGKVQVVARDLNRHLVPFWKHYELCRVLPELSAHVLLKLSCYLTPIVTLYYYGIT